MSLLCVNLSTSIEYIFIPEHLDVAPDWLEQHVSIPVQIANAVSFLLIAGKEEGSSAQQQDRAAHGVGFGGQAKWQGREAPALARQVFPADTSRDTQNFSFLYLYSQLHVQHPVET